MTTESVDENPPRDPGDAIDAGTVGTDRKGTDESDESTFAPYVRAFPWIAAGVTGAVAFLVEYVVLTGLITLHPAVSTAANTVLERLKSYGIVLFNSHNVPAVVVERGVTYNGPNRFNTVTNGTEAVPMFVYLAIPVVALLIAGALVERFRPDTGESLLEGSAIVGLGLVSGYVAVGLLATFAVATTTHFDPGSVTEGVDRVYALIALFAYPLVVGSVGALLVRAYDDYVA